MSAYMLISSRDTFEHAEAEHVCRLAVELKAAGHDVTLFLVQNGTLPARAGAENAALQRAIDADVTVLADEFSLRERAIDPDELAEGVQPAPLDVVIDGLAEGAKTIWH